MLTVVHFKNNKKEALFFFFFFTPPTHQTGLTRVELHSGLWWLGSVTFHLLFVGLIHICSSLGSLYVLGFWSSRDSSNSPPPPHACHSEHKKCGVGYKINIWRKAYQLEHLRSDTMTRERERVQWQKLMGIFSWFYFSSSSWRTCPAFWISTSRANQLAQFSGQICFKERKILGAAEGRWTPFFSTTHVFYSYLPWLKWWNKDANQLLKEEFFRLLRGGRDGYFGLWRLQWIPLRIAHD